MTDALTLRPQHQVLVNGGVTPESPLKTRFLDISNQVTRIQTVKTLGAPNGTFALTCTFEPPPGETQSLNRLLQPDNAVVINLNRGAADTDLQTVMLGFVRRVGTKTTVAANGRVQRDIVIVGEDAGKFLVRHELPGQLLSAFLWGTDEEARRKAAGLTIAGAPGMVLRRFFDFIFRVLAPAPIAVAHGVALAIDPRLDDDRRSYVYAEDVWMRQGKFWNILRGVADQPWTELFADYTTLAFDAQGPTQAPAPRYAIIARPHPFDPADWRALRTTVVPDLELRHEDVGLSDDERINLVLVAPNGLVQATSDVPTDAILFQTTQFDQDSSAHHGTQAMVTRTMYSDLGGASHDNPAVVAQAASGSGALLEALHERASKLWRWHSINHRLACGSWVIAGNPDIRIGERVENQSAPSDVFTPDEYERRTYYVEKVIQDYQDGSHYFTHLGLTRGQPLGQVLAAREPDRLGKAAA